METNKKPFDGRYGVSPIRRAIVSLMKEARARRITRAIIGGSVNCLPPLIIDDPCPGCSGKALRDKGTEAVMAPRPVFKELSRRLIDDLCETKPTLTAEVLQTEFMARYPHCPAPHPNAWGAAILGAVRRGKLKRTGLYVPTTKPASHARRIPVWETVATQEVKAA